MSVELIAVYLRPSSNWRQITAYLRAPGRCHSDALRAALPPTRVGSVIHAALPPRADRDYNPVCAACWTAEVGRRRRWPVSEEVHFCPSSTISPLQTRAHSLKTNRAGTGEGHERSAAKREHRMCIWERCPCSRPSAHWTLSAVVSSR